MRTRPDLVQRNRAIIALARSGLPPVEIAPRYGLNPPAVSAILLDARRAGEDIPRFRPIRRSRAGQDRKPAPESRPAEADARRWRDLSADEERRVGELARGGVSLTRIAALMRKPYAAVEAALARLGRVRAPGVAVERRAGP